MNYRLYDEAGQPVHMTLQGEVPPRVGEDVVLLPKGDMRTRVYVVRAISWVYNPGGDLSYVRAMGREVPQ